MGVFHYEQKELPPKPCLGSGPEFGICPNLATCGTSPSQGYPLHKSHLLLIQQKFHDQFGALDNCVNGPGSYQKLAQAPTDNLICEVQDGSLS